jgi:type I restriction enzyme S subunit
MTTSGYCGHVAGVADDPPEDTIVSNFLRILRFDPRRINARYAYHFMHRSAFREALAPFIRGTTMKNLATTDAFENVTMPVPRLGEQSRIVTLLDLVDDIQSERDRGFVAVDELSRSAFMALWSEPGASKWPQVAIADVAADRDGAVRTGPFGSQLLHSEFVESGIAVLGIDNAVSNEFRWVQRRFITESKYESLKRYTVRPGDVLITIMGTCGRCAVVPDDIPVAINTKHLCCISLDRAKCIPEFLHAYFLMHPVARRYLEQTAKGAIMSGLNMAIIKEMPLQLPPVGIQRLLKRRLESIAGVRRAQLRSKAHLDSLKTALQQQAFGERPRERVRLLAGPEVAERVG